MAVRRFTLVVALCLALCVGSMVRFHSE